MDVNNLIRPFKLEIGNREEEREIRKEQRGKGQKKLKCKCHLNQIAHNHLPSPESLNPCPRQASPESFSLTSLENPIF